MNEPDNEDINDFDIRRGRPPKITRERLVEVALEIGLADLTLTTVAKRLSVTIQTIYNHVKSREELLHLTAEVIEERFPMPEYAGETWADWMYKIAHALKADYELAPGFATVLMSRPPSKAPSNSKRSTLRREIALCAALRCGFDYDKALWAIVAVHEFTYGWVARAEQRGGAAGSALPKPAARGKKGEAAEPLTYRAYQAARRHTENERFDFTLKALLDGLLRAAAGNPATP